MKKLKQSFYLGVIGGLIGAYLIAYFILKELFYASI